MIAMIFNVLFVFFAMAINVALVVHDKINLQNATDLAAYYAATKQAEILDVIAHENYMIRQSWKLLTFRYRVMGTLGIYKGQYIHPARSGDTSDSVYAPAQTASVCITYFPNWTEVPTDENLCNEPELKIPPLPKVSVIAGFLGLNAGIAALSNQLIAQFNAECAKHGAFNWYYAMSALQAFRMDQRNRQQIITALANNLSHGQNGDFTDLDGNSVLTGATATFTKNLTFGNSSATLTLTNSLQGIEPTVWLPKINIAPTVIYTDIDPNLAAGCNSVNRSIDQTPQIPDAMTILQSPWPAGLGASALVPWAAQVDNFMAGSDYQFTLGVEKNPWVMAYTGASATTTTRQIFFPLAGGIPMKARGFAKPFGGRIGPWYGDHWDSGAVSSSGTQTDALAPPRMDATGGGGSQTDPTRLPNYSRYPGDTLGMTSRLAQNEIVGLINFKESYGSILNTWQDYSSGTPNDIMVMPLNNQPSPLRYMEMAALAPDLFDITYYSIEPEFDLNYLARLQANAAKLGIPGTTIVRPDLGFNGTSIPTFSVKQQMATVTSKTLQRQEAYYFVRDKVHLLTDWLPGPGAFNYDPSQAIANFGKCAKPDDGLKYPNPGACIAGGGRTGYSTKMVSYDLLTSADLAMGGGSGATGSIQNPPKNN
jgi:hypothetical protein